jgi:hypothetical protein
MVVMANLTYLQKMQNDVVAKYGFEARQTIDFFRACETAKQTMCADDILFIDDLYDSII